MASNNSNRIRALDGIRAVAILLVIGCHYPAFATSLGGLPEFGWIGVDIFFVLSGLLITTILLDLKGQRHAYTHFQARRVLRIMPPYFLVVLVVLGVSLFAHLAPPQRCSQVFWMNALFLRSMVGSVDRLFQILSVLTEAVKAPHLFVNHTLPFNVTGFSPTLGSPNTLDHLWSVSVEEWYYVLWAPVVLKCTRRSMIITASVLVVVAFYCRWLSFQDWQWYINFFCRIDMLAVGSLLAFWQQHRNQIPEMARARGDRAVSIGSIIAVACLAMLLLIIRPVLGREIRASLLFTAFGPFLIAISVAGLLAAILRARKTNVVARVCGCPVMAYLGRRSYMIYLVHIPVYFAVAQITAGLWTRAILGILLSIGLAVLSWRFFESPILLLRDRGWLSTVRSVPRAVMVTEEVAMRLATPSIGDP